MSEALIRFLARTADRQAIVGDAPTPHPDENAWGLLSDGLVTHSQRDELLRHAADCSACRRRMSAIVADWDETVLVAAGAPTALLETQRTAPISPTPLGDGAAAAKQWSRARPALVGVAAGIALVFVLVQRNTSTVTAIDESHLLAADVDLTALGVTLDGSRPLALTQPLSAREYGRMMTTLSRPLRDAQPSDRTLDLAVRAGLSAGEFESASRIAARWRGAAPYAAEAHNAFGLARFQLEAHADALAAFERALELSPDQPEYLLNAALAADRLGRIELARRYLQRVVTLAPDHKRRADIDGMLRRLGP